MALACTFVDSLSLYDNDQLLSSILETEESSWETQMWSQMPDSLPFDKMESKTTKNKLPLPQDTMGLRLTAPTKKTKQPKCKLPKALPKSKSKRATQVPKASLVSKKRKSMDWDAKPLEKRGQNYFDDPLAYFQDFAPSSRGQQEVIANTPLFEDDLLLLSDFFLPEVERQEVPRRNKPTLKRADSENWMSKPGKVKSKQTKTAIKPRQTQTSKTKTHTTAEPAKRKRLKWSSEENMKLWTGIYRYGNNWTEVKKQLSTRSYDQIKDKGRRLLFVQGWKTGRNKKNSDEAMNSAKAIAQRVLKKMSQA